METTRDQIDRLRELAKPLLAYLLEYYDPMCSIIIDTHGIRVENSVLNIPAKCLDAGADK